MTAPRFHLQALPPSRGAVPFVATGPSSAIGLDGVLDDLDRVGAVCEVPATAATVGFAWESRDFYDPSWFPQGITTSADATGSDLDGRDVLIASWYSTRAGCLNLGSRISCVDYSDRGRPAYRHVLLVERTTVRGRRRLKPVRVHAGGIVWYGPYLYVAGTKEGIRVFRLEDIIRMPDPRRAFGYDYVLPQWSGYGAHSDRGWEDMRYSFMSLDRSGATHHLVAGEYGRRGATHRLTRFALDHETHLLDTDEEDRSVPLELLEDNVERMQGATLVDGTWVITTSQGEGVPGDLWVGGPGAFERHRAVLPSGPEDITFWPARRELWSLTEWPGGRWVFAMDADRWGARPPR